MAELDRLIADDAQYHVSGNTPQLSGVHDGKQAVFEFFRQVSERSGGTFSLDIHDIVERRPHRGAWQSSRRAWRSATR
jgi:hypothetical protein